MFDAMNQLLIPYYQLHVEDGKMDQSLKKFSKWIGLSLPYEKTSSQPIQREVNQEKHDIINFNNLWLIAAYPDELFTKFPVENQFRNFFFSPIIPDLTLSAVVGSP